MKIMRILFHKIFYYTHPLNTMFSFFRLSSMNNTCRIFSYFLIFKVAFCLFFRTGLTRILIFISEIIANECYAIYVLFMQPQRTFRKLNLNEQQGLPVTPIHQFIQHYHRERLKHSLIKSHGRSCMRPFPFEVCLSA